jgi:hypothetical protein
MDLRVNSSILQTFYPCRLATLLLVFEVVALWEGHASRMQKVPENALFHRPGKNSWEKPTQLFR